MNSWPERWASSYEAARRFWTDQGFTEDVTDGDVTFSGSVVSRLKVNGVWEAQDFRVDVVYPPGSPYVPPRVRFVEPAISYSRHLEPGNKPCLFPTYDWDETVPASEVHKKLKQWIKGYRTGEWDHDLALYELPAYYTNARMAPSVLLADGTVDAMKDRSTGTFSLQTFAGTQLAVLDVLDDTEIGRNLVADIGLARGSKFEGEWFRLGTEPDPIYGETELRRVMKLDGHVLKVERDPHQRVVGLVFPDAHEDAQRFLILVFGDRSKNKRRPPGAGWKTSMLPSYSVSHEEMFKRLKGIRDVDLLDQRSITIHGCGAIGSHLAIALCREGVGGFQLCDPDRLTPGNVIRHALDLTSVGRMKADALADALHRINPHCEAEPVHNMLSNPDLIEAHFEHNDLLISAIGDDVVENLISEIATHGHKPMILVRTLHGGSAFRVCLFRPGRDACLTCLALHREDNHADWIEFPADDALEPIYDEGCAAPSRPGSGLASQQAAIHAAQIAIDVLSQQDPEHNHWVVIREPIESSDNRLQEVGLQGTTFARHPECPRCAS